jgi:hypothetical protein
MVKKYKQIEFSKTFDHLLGYNITISQYLF